MTKYRKIVSHTAVGPAKETISSKRWEATDDQSKHTPLSAAVFEKVMADFTKYGDNFPQILSINSFDDVHYQFEIEITLPGGVVVEIDSRTIPGYTPVAETLPEAADEAAELVSDLIGNCAEIGFKKLTDQFDNARSEINKLFEQWSNDGDAHIDLVDLRLSTEPYWQNIFDTSVQITISCLSEALFPEKMQVKACCPGEAVAKVTNLHREMKSRTQTKARLKSHGADGFIDLIALNLLLFGDSAKAQTENYLPKLRESDLHQDLKVKCGRIYLEAIDSADVCLIWHDGRVEILDLEIPSTLCDSLPGKPITDLIEHPFLTPEVIIKDLWCIQNYSRITFKQPCFFFSKNRSFLEIEKARWITRVT